MAKKNAIISLGGSLIVPNGVDIRFLKKFKSLILKHLREYNFVIFTGGGKIAREYQKAGKEVGGISQTQMDWLGIWASILNAQLIKNIFKNEAYTEIITVPTKKIKWEKPLIIGAGWKPGWSTDFDAVKLAQINKIDKVINLSNIKYVYNKDPKKFKDAKKIEKICWPDFRRIIGYKWKPGLNAPFDPVAAELAEKSRIKVAIIGGENLIELDNCLKNNKFKGTLII
ncbi:MAG: UMP kinase [Patescibacteria group bacterium]|jgi:uridylate kinase